MTAEQKWLKTCPLCGGDNQCAMAADQAAEICWCQAVTISAASLAAIPADSVDKRCLCPACGRTQGGTSHAR